MSAEAAAVPPGREAAEAAETSERAGRIGLWVFLASEIMLFAVLFTVYTVNRLRHPAVWLEASTRLDIALGTINTAILLVSSYTMALAVEAAAERARRVRLLLVLTAILGSAFLGIKMYEWTQEAAKSLVPGAGFVWPGADPGGASLFFASYFVMTGLHAIHLTVGVALILVLAWMARPGPGDWTPRAVALGGLYWHLVDVIWIFLFPLLYLPGAGR